MQANSCKLYLYIFSAYFRKSFLNLLTNIRLTYTKKLRMRVQLIAGLFSFLGGLDEANLAIAIYHAGHKFNVDEFYFNSQVKP